MFISRNAKPASLETCSCGDPMQPMPMRDLISDIHALDRELQRFEEKYNLLSEDFYQLYETGRLRDEVVVEEIDDYGRWAALYRMRLRRKAQQDRIPAPGISFDQPNLPFLIEEIEYNLLSS